MHFEIDACEAAKAIKVGIFQKHSNIVPKTANIQWGLTELYYVKNSFHTFYVHKAIFLRQRECVIAVILKCSIGEK